MPAMMRFDDGLAQFELVLAINPHNAGTHVNFGSALCQLHCIAEANGQFHQAHQLDPDNAAAKAALAQP